MKKISRKLERALIDLANQRKQLKRDIAKLTKAGCINGSIHEQEKRPGYIVSYINHRQQLGEPRRREYLGIDPVKIKHAQESIARHAKRADLLMQERAVSDSMLRLESDIAYAIDRALSAAKTQSRMW